MEDATKVEYFIYLICDANSGKSYIESIITGIWLAHKQIILLWVRYKPGDFVIFLAGDLYLVIKTWEPCGTITEDGITPGQVGYVFSPQQSFWKHWRERRRDGSGPLWESLAFSQKTFQYLEYIWVHIPVQKKIQSLTCLQFSFRREIVEFGEIQHCLHLYLSKQHQCNPKRNWSSVIQYQWA